MFSKRKARFKYDTKITSRFGWRKCDIIRGIQDFVKWEAGYGQHGAQAYIGSLRALPSVGSRGNAPGQGVRGTVSPEANDILHKER